VLTFQTGDPVTVVSTFKNATGESFDPEVVTLEWGRPPSPTTWTYGTGQITRVSAGVYRATFTTLHLAGSSAVTCFAQFVGNLGNGVEPNNYASFKVYPRPL
jgi:hypothetical protein